nr:hypothetical transcript [Hymenolepis microstoma]
MIVFLTIDCAIIGKLHNPKQVYCCLWLSKQNRFTQSLLLDPPADSAGDFSTKNSDTTSSTISPWSNSVHSKLQNQDESEMDSE